MQIDPNNTKPIFFQISEFIEDLILEDEIQLNEQVYSTNQLSKIFTINPATARKGLNILLEQGVIYKKRGVGMFVSENAKQIILDRRRGHFFDMYIATMMSEATKLGLKKEEIIHYITHYEKEA